MKTAISVPDDIFQEGERAAERLGWSRSQLYARALSEFLETQDDDPVTMALDSLADELTESPSPSIGRSLIDAGVWEW